MATATFQNPVYVRPRLGGVMPYARGGDMESYFGEAPTPGPWGINDLLYIDSSGNIAICTTSSSLLDSAIAGLAKEASTGTDYNPVEFFPIHPNDVFEMNTYHATAATSVPTRAMLGTVRGIFMSSATSSKWCVDVENSVEGSNHSGARVLVVGFAEYIIDSTTGQVVKQNIPSTSPSVTGDIYGRLMLKFLEFSIAQTGTLAGKRILQL